MTHSFDDGPVSRGFDEGPVSRGFDEGPVSRGFDEGLILRNTEDSSGNLLKGGPHECDETVSVQQIGLDLLNTTIETQQQILDQQARIHKDHLVSQRSHVWAEAANAALSCEGINVSMAIACADIVLEAFDKRFKQ